MLNATVTGHLGRDATLKTVGAGKIVCNFSIATSHKEETIWVNCAMWGVRAEKIKPYLIKGKPVAVAGELWTRKGTDGNTYLELEVSNIHLMGGEKREQRGPVEERESIEEGQLGADGIPF